jgi:hypothetical protein
MRRTGTALGGLVLLAALGWWLGTTERGPAPRPQAPAEAPGAAAPPSGPLATALAPSTAPPPAVPVAGPGGRAAATVGPAPVVEPEAPTPDHPAPTVVWCARVLEVGTDEPLEGATATTCHPRDHTPDRAVPVATSGPDGRLELVAPAGDRRTLRIDHAGHVYHVERLEDGHGTFDQEVVVRLGRAAAQEVLVVETSRAPTSASRYAASWSSRPNCS